MPVQSDCKGSSIRAWPLVSADRGIRRRSCLKLQSQFFSWWKQPTVMKSPSQPLEPDWYWLKCPLCFLIQHMTWDETSDLHFLLCKTEISYIQIMLWKHLGSTFAKTEAASWEAGWSGGKVADHPESNHLGLNFDSTLHSPVTLDKSFDPLRFSSKNGDTMWPIIRCSKYTHDYLLIEFMTSINSLKD